MLTDQEIEDIGEEHAPYVDHKFARAIESAACAERDARIAELEAAAFRDSTALNYWKDKCALLEQQLEEARKDAEELKFLNGDLLYWVARAVSNGNANSDTEDAYERYEQWLSARHNAAIKEQT